MSSDGVSIPITRVGQNEKTKKSFLLDFFLLLVGFLAFVLIVVMKSKTASYFEEGIVLFSYTVFVTCFQLSRVIGAMFSKGARVRVIPTDAHLYEPTVTFVIPCKNEERSIAKTVEQCFSAEYPGEKMEVIVINDGSTDGTGTVLRTLAPLYRNLTVINWEVNRGKRQGMTEGIRRARGEIIIQLDSDSYLMPSTVRKIIEPFANPSIGAVCAYTEPENADTNVLTRMQAAYYFVAYKILKAAESTFLTVFCCSGCASAYRKSLILPVLERWLGEKFLGLPVTWGDDRGLTNRVLEQGFQTIYTDEAQAFTIVPEDLKTFLKQQVRWKKGWFVNSVFALKFVFKKYPFVSFTYFLPLIVVTLLTPFMAARAMIYNPMFHGIVPTYYVISALLIALVMTCYYRFVSNDNKYWTYVFVWSGMNIVLLSYILFYAILTIQNRSWGTR